MDYESYLDKYEQSKEWQRKGATLSDKTARQEFGLTQDEIYDAIEAGTIQYRQAYMHGNPWLRLLRREVETLARSRHGDRHVDQQQDSAELARVNREIRRLRSDLAELEKRRSALSTRLGESTAPPGVTSGGTIRGRPSSGSEGDAAHLGHLAGQTAGLLNVSDIASRVQLDNRLVGGRRYAALRETHSRKPSLITRLDRAGLTAV